MNKMMSETTKVIDPKVLQKAGKSQHIKNGWIIRRPQKSILRQRLRGYLNSIDSVETQ